MFFWCSLIYLYSFINYIDSHFCTKNFAQFCFFCKKAQILLRVMCEQCRILRNSVVSSDFPQKMRKSSQKNWNYADFAQQIRHSAKIPIQYNWNILPNIVEIPLLFGHWERWSIQPQREGCLTFLLQRHQAHTKCWQHPQYRLVFK